MKKTGLFIVLLFLLTTVSCNMEKRLYRNGWYKAHNEKTARAENSLVAEKSVPAAEMPVVNEPAPDTAAVIPSTVPAVDSAKNDSVKTNPVKEFRKKLDDSPVFKKRMTYAEAMASIAEKGGTPNKFARTVYLLSIISICTTIIGGIGIYLAITTLILSIFAINSVIAEGGNCMEENLAIIRLAQRNCWLLFAILALIAILFIGFVLTLIYYTNGF